MKPEQLNQYWYKRYLLEGDVILDRFDKKESQDLISERTIKRSTIKLRPPIDNKEKSRRKREGISKKIKPYAPKKKRAVRVNKNNFERNKYHFLDYKDVIRGNTTDENCVDNKLVIDHLNGDRDAIWKLYNKHQHQLSYLIYNRLGEPKDATMNITDLIMEGFISVIPMIEKGKYKGHSFFSFCFNYIRWWILGYYKTNGYSVQYTRKNLYNSYTNVKKY